MSNILPSKEVNGNTYSRINASCYSSFDNFVMIFQAFETEEFNGREMKESVFKRFLNSFFKKIFFKFI